LLAAIVGSGIMAERLAGGNEALALLCNSLATGAILVVLIAVFGPVSGAHLNPAVTVAFLSRAEVSAGSAIAYVGAQILGAVLGTWLAHAMFNETLFQVSLHDRQGAGLWLAEAVATFGLVLTIFGTLRWKPEATPLTVGLYITSAYWFTASTSFANPAVTIARSLTNTFAGIAPPGVPPFIIAQLVGAIAAASLSGWLLPERAIPQTK
jgi:glycerol uptake facilitator-like aquaporin